MKDLRERLIEKKKNLPQAVIYCRVSTQMQVGPGHYSISMQRELCSKYAEENNIPIRGIFIDEGKSGTSRKGREKLEEALLALKTGDYFIVYHLTRLARSIRDGLEILDYIKSQECEFISITQNFNTSTSGGKLMLNIMLSFAEFEAENTRERIVDGLNERKRQGKFIGRIPYGYMDNGEGLLIPNNDDYEILIELVDMREKNKLSFAKICKILNESNKMKKDKLDNLSPWYPSTVRSAYCSYKKLNP
jgi:site-specific DNA recombinase